jgi:uncharacterized protein
MKHRIKWFVLALSCLALLVLLAGCSSFHKKQGDWIFSPVRTNGGVWGNSGQAAVNMQEVWIEFKSEHTGQDVKLHGLWHEAKTKNAPVLLYLHGARWNVIGSAFRINRMQELGFHVLAVDYRGFGKTSEETPSEESAYEDAKAAWSWLGKKYPNTSRYIFGHSLGGTIAIELAAQVSDEAGTIVEGTFTSVPDVFRTFKWGWLPISGLITQRFEAINKVARIGSPLLVVHGSQDQTIQPELGKKLFDAAAEPKRFLLIQGGSHHNTNAIGQVAYRVALAEMFGISAP